MYVLCEFHIAVAAVARGACSVPALPLMRDFLFAGRIQINTNDSIN